MSLNTEQVTIHKTTLRHSCFSVNALIFLPAKAHFNPKHVALFTHGFTSAKFDLITWATRLSEAGIATGIFDLPGHYLGSFQELNSWEDFQKHAHDLFALCYNETLKLAEAAQLSFAAKPQLFIGGHSLGALLALKSHVLKDLPENKIYLCIGLGINKDVKVHLFDTDFYQKTLNIRRQLVSPLLDPKIVFPWIKNHKDQADIKNANIVLICGQDDAVVGKGGAEHLREILAKNNNVELIEPARLPHHEPELAAGPIYHYLKKLL